MALAVRRDPGMGGAEYQVWVADRRDEERWELIDGEPVLVAEVLSTMSRDRGRKTDFYRSIASLHVFLIVYQGEPRVEAWRRGADRAWTKQALRLGATIDLPELGGRLAVADIYDDIDF